MIKNIFLFSLFFTFLSISSEASENKYFEIVTPISTDIHDENTIAVVVKINDHSIDNIVINTPIDATSLHVTPKKDFYCQNLSIVLGENNISVEAYKDNKIVSTSAKKVYFTSKVHKDYKYPPLEFEYNYFHTKKNEKICAKCHDMSVNEIKGVAFEDVTKSNCYTCHKPIGYKKHAHAPTVNWLCTSCHTGNVGKYNRYDNNKSRFIAPDPIGPICFSCHKKTKKDWATKRFKHEPVESGRCNKCHNPHGSYQINYLRKPEFELCTSCHKDKINGSHIIRTYSKKIHPVHGKRDPLRKGRELSCVSCHEPHASNSSSFIKAENVMSLCNKCHKK